MFKILLLLSALSLNGKDRIDSLKSELAGSKEPPKRVLLMSKLGIIYAQRSNFDSSISICSQAITLAEKINAPQAKAEAYYALGFAHASNYHRQQAATSYKKSLNFCENTGYIGDTQNESNLQTKLLSGIAMLYHGLNVDSCLKYRLKLLSLAKRFKFNTLEENTLLELGHTYGDNGQFGNALSCYFESYNLRKRNGSNNPVIGTYRSIGYFYVDQGDFEKAMPYLYQSLRFKQKAGKGVHYELAHLSNAYEGLNKLDSALYFAEEAITAAQRNKVHHELGYIYITYAKAAERLGDFSTALIWYKKGIDKCVEQDNQKTLAGSYFDIARLFLTLNNPDSAIYYANQSIRFANASGFPKAALEASGTLAAAYKIQHKLDSSLKYHEQMVYLKDSLFRNDKAQRVQIIATEQAQQEKDLKIEETRKKTQIQLIAATAFILIAGSFLFFVYRNRLLTKQNADLQQALLMGQTTERKRVAADLHDGLGSSLTALGWNLEALNAPNLDPSQRKVYENLRAMLDRAHADVRLLSHNMLPDELLRQGLPAALENFVRKINQNKLITLALHFSSYFPRFSPKIEFELYSICLELINNIIKHALASEGGIDFDLEGRKLTLIVSDNGRGLRENDSNGMGLKNIKERVESLNGQWKVTSTEGNGLVNVITLEV